MKSARDLIIARHKECGIGLCGSFEAIARWLFREHNIITSDTFVAQVIREYRRKNEDH